MLDKLKALYRKITTPIFWNFYYRFVYQKFETTRDGKPLKSGITAVVSAKNESGTISLCLRSLIGIADQVVCIDNGSDDDTLSLMKQFQKEFKHLIEIDVLSMPGALLGDCREAGLKATRYSWHLRWDADMICKTSGKEDMKLLREKILKDHTPRAIQLPRTNLRGDFHHTLLTGDVVDPGEPILVKFSRKIFYKEYGKFDTIKLPFFYTTTSEKKNYYFHCEGLKSAANLVHRFHYFKWRETLNATPISQRTQEITDYDLFCKLRNIELLGTNEKLSVHYRFMKMYIMVLTPYNPDVYGEYPEIILEEIKNGRERFKVVYKDGLPFDRIDYADPDLLNYSPTEADLDYDVKQFFRVYFDEAAIEKFFTPRF